MVFSVKKQKLNILFVASEAGPFIKIGGLGEVMHSLPKALRELGHDARVLTPKYGSMDTSQYRMERIIPDIRAFTGEHDPFGILVCNILAYKEGGGAITNYFLENEEFYEKRANVYGYADDTARWVLLSRGALEFVRRSDWKPDIIVASDWQTGFLPNLLKTEYKNTPELAGITVVFSIHNLKFQGLFDPKFVSEMDYDSGQQDIPTLFDPRITKLNGMRRGIMYADAINTVSPTYAKEILTEEFGETLEKLLDERKGHLYGILNGIDTDSLNPEDDPDVLAHYSYKNIEKRRENKLALQNKFGLPEDPDIFTVGIVSRMDGQKGFDLIVQVADALMANVPFQLFVLGDGANEFRTFFQELQKRFPNRVAGHYFFDPHLPRLIFSGADTLLMPSRFEPCGLTQLEAMRYGCIPIVRKVGGLADSVEDFNPAKDTGTGFVFEKYDTYSLLIAVIRAFDAYGYKAEWTKLQKRSMQEDFSWKKSAQEYLKIFASAVKVHQER